MLAILCLPSHTKVTMVINMLYICITQTDTNGEEDSLNVENTLWANTVVASGKALGLVVYTGQETRSVMNTSQPSSKVKMIKLLQCLYYSY